MKRVLLPTFSVCIINLSFLPGVCQAEWVWATEVVEHSTPVPGHLPEKVFGPPDCSATCSGLESARCSFTVDGEPGSGIPGYMVVGFGTRVYDVPGNDIEVHVFDLNSDEQFKVYACESPGNCVFVCSVDPLDPGVNCTCETCSFGCDLADADVPITCARYIKIENGREDPDTIIEGPEVDAVRAVRVPIADCNDNGIPDECDIDCGMTGGVCDVAGCGMRQDCNGNCVPDECDLTDGTLHDVNTDGIPDECGACCGGQGCIQVVEARCETFGKYRGDGTVCEEECPEGIPTVSEWGLVAMTLLVLTAGTVILMRRRRSVV